MSDLSVKFIEHLKKTAEQNRAARATLRRSLSFPPGEWPPAFPYVEPFCAREGNEKMDWRRRMLYLIAGLWAAAGPAGPGKESLAPLGQAVRWYADKHDSASTEKRFIALLDADPDQLPHRLRQMCALLKEYSLDFAAMLDGLLYWNFPERRTRTRWARHYYSGDKSALESAGPD
jgi:CRISPR system Cascade subunit CasB